MIDSTFMSSEEYDRITARDNAAQASIEAIAPKPLMSFSAMTAEDYYRLNGTLDAGRIEALLDAEVALDTILNVESNIQEALGQFPDEDFLSPAIKRLQTLARNLRGDNKERIQTIIQEIEELQQSTYQASEYGVDELKKALKQIKGED